jgi:peptide/nickel transport system ATP-binding protein
MEAGWTGDIELGGKPIGKKRSREELTSAQMVFQDPYGSLHPRHRIGTALAEPLRAMRHADIWSKVERALIQVGLPASFANRFPHELSGGQRQRVAIARALILSPPILLLDEPTSALDVSVQAEILNLLQDLRKERGLTYLLVSHDLAVVSHMCSRVAIMEAGEIVEQVDIEALRRGAVEHPYSQRLLRASRMYGRA